MKKISNGMRVWIMIIAVIVVMGAIGAYFGKTTQGSYGRYGSSTFGGGAYPYIGVLYIEGVISAAVADPWSGGYGYNHGWIINQIDVMMNDSNNKGIVLFIDSPGGGVYETDELYLKIKEYTKLTERPVYAAMGSMAASGGYYTAVAAEQIYANRNTLTGSIGITMGTIYDISEFLDRYGIKATTITSGRNKAMGDMTQPLTEEQKSIFQSIADEAYGQFVSIVANERDMEIEKAIEVADGRIYTAAQAKELGLVDEIGTIRQAISDMKIKYDLSGCDVRDIYYVDDSFIARLMRMQAKIRIPGELGAVLELSGQDEQMRLESPINYYFQF